ncbi:TetR/AcrR family transcriptional regulator C-terminal domain-containing protein [Streptomyces sp. B1I3]|uniref:TetR/AcrR family transcriptional regulator C-terminal domain-containing protein n=1 Tax=Streptomyces sp. B1I3 TaxID=3042264 RepID=UPI00277FD924|nr:hypothetical protein [Streptomyces sp. B1I3]MDQ0794897.1 hypothetical protein [Streptomyces sp. B1I3]
MTEKYGVSRASYGTRLSDLAAVVEAKGVPPRDATAQWERTVERPVGPVRHPALSRLLPTEVMSEPDEADHGFVSGLGWLLDGVETLIGRGARS